jgi:hypothetical protein
VKDPVYIRRPNREQAIVGILGFVVSARLREEITEASPTVRVVGAQVHRSTQVRDRCVYKTTLSGEQPP